jgi:hypothetical protein
MHACIQKVSCFRENEEGEKCGAPGTHWIGGWVDPRAGLGDVEKRNFFTLLGLELRLLSRPAHTQLQYRLRCPGSFFFNLHSGGWNQGPLDTAAT